MADLLECPPVSCTPHLLDSGGDDQDLMVKTLETAHSGYGISGDEGAAASYAARLPCKIMIPLARSLAAPAGLFTGDLLHDMRCGLSRRPVGAVIRKARVKAGRQDIDGPLVRVGDSLGAVTGCSFRVALLLTVGAPIGFSREINMVPAPAGLKAPGGLVRSWLNG